MREISLASLTRDDLGRLVADTLSCTQDRAAPLAQLVHEKTGGNPFFANQFIFALAEEGLLRFDHDGARWRWQHDRIHAKGYTDNVADLMVGRLARLPADARAALQQLACLGNVTEIAMLSIVLGKSNEEVRADLLDAVRLELVEHSEGSYRFTPRPGPRGRLFIHAGTEARRGAPAHREAACGTDTCGKTRGGNFRDRQSFQPRHHLGYLARRT